MTQIDEPTIQPIKSHTEILIQQAYDRGYADKAMKVDQAIEMEHSPKDCTLPCHVHQDTTSIDERLDEILRKVPCIACDGSGAIQINEDGDVEQCQYCYELRLPYFNEAKAAIKQLFLDVVGGDLPIGDEIAEGRSYTGERLHNKIKAQLRTTIIGKEGGDGHTKSR